VLKYSFDGAAGERSKKEIHFLILCFMSVRKNRVGSENKGVGGGERKKEAWNGLEWV